MATRSRRLTGLTSLVGTAAAALSLAGVAVFTAQAAACDTAGEYVVVDGHTELVGGCLDPADLPQAPAADPTPTGGVGSGLDRLHKSP